jgi:hypothetical protein
VTRVIRIEETKRSSNVRHKSEAVCGSHFVKSVGNEEGLDAAYEDAGSTEKAEGSAAVSTVNTTETRAI